MSTDTRRQVHELVDQLPPVQLDALRNLLESMVDPVARALANAPIDDEPISAEDREALREAERWLEQNEGVPHEEVLADFGLSLSDFPLRPDSA